MQKLRLGRRLMATLLALTMIVSLIPNVFRSAKAATGDIYPDIESTGLTGDINTKDTISWPIKIYDYLNDGMLFEYSSAGHTKIFPHTGGSYGGGEIMPMTGNIIGEDYTSVAGYYNVSGGQYSGYTYTEKKHSFQYWGNTSAFKVNYDSNATEVVRSINQPVKDVSPMSLHLTYDHSTKSDANTKSYGWVSNFARDHKKYYTGNQVRYMVLVYKTNDVYPVKGHTVRPYWAVSDSSYSSDYATLGNSIDISDTTDYFGRETSAGNKTGLLMAKNVYLPQSLDWGYLVIDMKSDDNAEWGIQSNWKVDWDNDGQNELNLSTMERVAGVGLALPLCGKGEEMDISHIAYFSSKDEANNFGERAVAFDKDPGEYTGYEMTMTHTVANGTVPVSALPSITNNGWDFTKSGNSAWSDYPYSAWNDTVLSSSSTWMSTTRITDTKGYTYSRIGSYDSHKDWLSFYSSSGATRTSIDHIVLVYKTSGISGSPTMGFGITDGTNYAGWGDRSYTYQMPTPASSSWTYIVYPLDKIGENTYSASTYSKISKITQIKWWLPGLTTTEKFDLAFVDYFADSTTAEAFGQAAVAYLKNYGQTVTTSGSSITTTINRSTNTIGGMWNMGSNQGFTLLYAANGGGWAYENGYSGTTDDVAGGVNKWTNGYYSYQIGYNYMFTNATSSMNGYKTNADRENAKNQGKNYRVSDSIFLLNTYAANNKYLNDPTGYYYKYYTEAAATTAVKNSSNTNLYGVKYDVLQGYSSTYGTYYYAGNKTFDMSQLNLGYTLYNTMKDGGVMTAGLLQSSMSTHKGMDGQTYKLMQYKDDTIMYIATLLRDSLVIPERDYWGYNYNFVKGTPSPLFCEDVDGDGKLDTVNEDLDGDGHLDVNEDLDGDGELDYSEDFDGDGHLDVFEDLNHNGELDESEDLDGDGHLDVDEDLDGDGLIDPGEDVDGDGKLDVNEDRNGNGVLDLSEDIDGDGKLDCGEDKNFNGILDPGEDLNNNGVLDLYEDLNGNGILDLGEDVDGDGKLDTKDEDVDGDGNLDVDEDHYGDPNRYGYGNGVLDSCDLATALRQCLGITFDMKKMLASSSNPQQGTATAALGSYDLTSKKFTAGPGKANQLIGPFLKCAPYIETFYDAAYYLLHNTFVPKSYNHVETDYNYLVMSKGYVTSENKYAYVFDAGFTYEDGTIATVYDDVQKTISQAVAEKKHHIAFDNVNTTTLHPFLPINDSKDVAGAPGSEFKATGTPYVSEDGATGVSTGGSTYADRNYNYVMTANGEFVYHKDDDLFFDFEGDDDVYMFVNGELVLDIGAAHSITKVGFKMNDYVKAAQSALEPLKQYGYRPDMEDELFLSLFTADKVNRYTFDDKGNVTSTTEITNPLKGKYTDVQIQELLRQHRLNLVDGNSYDIDFYYMERHGWGANMRIATNIVMTDPTLVTDKTAYQGTDANGDPQEITYGGLIDDSQPVNYSFAVTNKGNTKLYKLSFADENIGVDISAANGLQVFGKATKTKFTATADTTLSITGLNGVFNLDGKVYSVRIDGTISWVEDDVTHTTFALPITYDSADAKNNVHTLTLYQYDSSKLFNDVDVAITLGNGSSNHQPVPDQDNYHFLQLNSINTVKVLGVRVSDAKGGVLEPKDLTITVNGYASPEAYAAYEEAYTAYLAEKETNPNIGEFVNKWCIKTISVSVSNNAELKAFLTNLQDPKSQTSEGEGVPAGKSALYYGAGLWQNGTVTISGMWYSLSEDEQADKVFNNTVYTKAYKSMNSEDPAKSQDTHRVYSPGEPMYYQWANKNVFLGMNRFWEDVVKASASVDNTMHEQAEGINRLVNAGVSTLALEIVDRNGEKVSVTNNYYEYGKWTTLPGSVRTAPDGYRTIYFKQIYDWKGDSNEQQIYVYYWSDANKRMSTWPGEKMTYTKTDTDGKEIYQIDIPSNARYVIFNNGAGTQTADIPVPIVDYDKVHWDSTNRVLDVNYDSEGMHMFYVKVSSSAVTDTVLVPVSFYVTYVEDKSIVLDYGLGTKDFNINGQIFSQDDLLGSHNSTAIKLMGVTTKEPTYLTTYSSTESTNNNINRILFQTEAGEAGADGTRYFDMGDGKFYTSGTIATDGITIDYNNSVYSMDWEHWFVPEKFMDEEYNLWLALSVHAKDAVKPSGTAAAGQSQYHAVAPAGKGVIDIGNEVQMFKKITVVPATVVYYEDDFAAIKYTGPEGTFKHHGAGSGSLIQSIDQQVPYGQDSTYQPSGNAEISGNVVTTINIADSSDVANFTFTGTGFEIISRTNAFDSAAFYVKVTDQNGNVIKQLPVITEFTSGSSACKHTYHNTNGYCTYCAKSISHTYVNGVCKVCNVQELDYYLMGYINNANHDGNSYVYKFVDGKLTVTFESESYLVIHDSRGKEYWANGYPGNATSTMLYDLNSFTQEQKNQNRPDKLRVPGGVEVTLTLMDNGDGTMALSYTHDPIVHGERTLYFAKGSYNWDEVYIYYWSNVDKNMVSWPGVPMDPVEDKDGYYTFKIPSDADFVVFNKGEGGSGNQTTDQTIPGDNYIYKDGKWYVYGEENNVVEIETKVLYFNNTAGWEIPHAHYWNSGDGTGWPGIVMTQVKDALYSIEVPVDMTGIIFNNGNGGDGNQTGDLSVPDANQVYNYSTGTWSEYVEEAPTTKIVYFDNRVMNWSGIPNAYFWGAEGANGWPGTPMTHVEGTVYSIELPVNMPYIIFNDGSGNQTSDLTIPGDGYVYDNGWSKYGEVTYYTVYFKNIYGWSKPSAHYWSDLHQNMTAWPGNFMTLVEGDVYSIQVRSDAQYIIFSNNGNSQTANLTLEEGKPCYADGTWYTYPMPNLTRVIYFNNIGNWDQVYVYYWSSSNTNMVAQPGLLMTHMAGSYFTAEIPQSAKYVRFTNGGTEQTGSLTLSEKEDLYTGNTWATYIEGSTKEIHQVPVIRVTDLPYGVYTVTITGMPTYKDDTDWGKYDDKDYMASQVKPTYLYIDGVRIYQPVTSTNSHYSDAENGATFIELRDLILAGKASVATYDLGTTIYNGNLSWCENRNHNVPNATGSSTAFNSNQVSGINDYMIIGPNNEVYLNGNMRKEAVVFYVKEIPTEKDRTLQIAARAINDTLFLQGQKSDVAASLYQGMVLTAPDGTTSFGWSAVDIIESGTEQYYTIDYSKCPYDAATGTYQVALYVRNGMASLSNVKYKGLTFSASNLGNATVLYYDEGGILVTPEYKISGIAGDKAIEPLAFGPSGNTSAIFEEDTQIYVTRKVGSVTENFYGSEALSIGAGTATLSNNATATEMLTIPAGVEVNFTLLDNGNGTLTMNWSANVETFEMFAISNGPGLNMASISLQMASETFIGEVVPLPGETVKTPALNMTGVSLSFDDEIRYNIYFDATDVDDVVEMGLITFGDRLTDGTIADAVDVIAGAVTDGDEYMVHTNGIPAKKMSDLVFFKVYAKLSDGSYVYSDVAGYNAVYYAKYILANSKSQSMKELVVSMLNYGAAAQQYFGYNAENPMNAWLTAEQQALVNGYDESMLDNVVSADASKLGSFVKTEGFSNMSASVSFEGAFAINYYMTPDKAVEGDMTMYFWTAEAYANASQLTAENATGCVTMTAGPEYWANVCNIAAKKMDETVYVACVYTSGGETYCTGVLAYSLACYCEYIAADESSAMQALAQATAVYGSYAKNHFAN